MYRRPKFLTVLHEIRQTMSREADYDVDLFAEMVRSGTTMKLALPGHLWLARREPKSGSVPHDKNERTRAIEAFKETDASLAYCSPLRHEEH